MNRDFVLFCLGEAQHVIDSTRKAIESDTDYDEANLLVDMLFIYQNVNMAWNARHASQERAKECAHKDFREWSQFPTDFEMDAFVGTDTGNE